MNSTPGTFPEPSVFRMKRSEQPEELPDLDQVILVYCRSGNRSRQAAQKLFVIGYTNVYEFGGINDWTGEIVTDADSNETETERKVTDEKDVI